MSREHLASAGEVIAVIGHNVGKTTVLRTRAGLLKVSSGSAHLAGRDVTH